MTELVVRSIKAFGVGGDISPTMAVITEDDSGKIGYHPILSLEFSGALAEMEFIGGKFNGQQTTKNADNSVALTNFPVSIGTGSGWDGTYTFSLTGVCPEKKALFFRNNSGHPQTIAGDNVNTPNGAGAPYDVPHDAVAFFSSEGDGEISLIGVWPTWDGAAWLGSAGGAVAIEDEGNPVVAAAATINFAGDGISAVDAGGGTVTVTVAPGAAPVASVNGETGVVVLDASEIDIVVLVPGNYTPADASVEGHLSGIDTALGGKAATAHTHDAAALISGTLANERVAQSNVTQHQAAIDHDALTNFDAAEHRQMLVGTIGARPAASVANRFYWATDEKKLYRDSGTVWDLVDAGDADTLGGQNSAFHLSRANHTGSQLSATISDLTEVVQDIVAAMAVAGANMTINYDDGAGTLTFISSASGGGVAVEDDGAEILALASRLNFIGAGVSVVDAGAGEASVTIPGGGATSIDSREYLGRIAAGTGPAIGLAMPPEFNVMDYGADSSGVADSRAALQAALDAAGAAGGGTVTMPPGTFKIVNQSLAEHALTIDSDNVTLQGAGMFATRLVFRVAGDLDPAANWELKNGGTEVHRGNGIGILNSADPTPRKNIILRDFEYDGGAGKTDNATFPADIGTGDGWDLTHKGVTLPENAAGKNMLLERLWIHTWRGEITYRGGGGELENVTTRDCIFSDTNANGYNISCKDLKCINNLMLDCYTDAAEVVTIGDALFADNTAKNCGLGIVIAARLGTTGQVAIVRNRLSNITRGAAVRFACANALVANNQIQDFALEGILSIQPEAGIAGADLNRSGQLITGNIFQAKAASGQVAVVVLGTDASPLHDVVVEGNLVDVPNSATADIETAFKHGLSASCQRVVFRNNSVLNARRLSNVNDLGGYPGTHIKFPLFHNNEDHARERYLVSSIGTLTNPMGAPLINYFGQSAFHTPAPSTLSHYPIGFEVTIIAPDAGEPTLIPRLDATFRCPTDRYIYSGCRWTGRFDGARFVEIAWEDGRTTADTTQTTGTTLDALGRTSIILTYAGATTLVAHQAIPQGVPIVIRATNGNATLQHNAAIQLVGGVDLTLVANRPYVFVRDGTVLKEVNAGAGGISAVAQVQVAITAGGALSDATHGELAISGSTLQKRNCTVLHSTPSSEVALTFDQTLTQDVVLDVMDTQTGAVKVQPTGTAFWEDGTQVEKGILVGSGRTPTAVLRRMPSGEYRLTGDLTSPIDLGSNVIRNYRQRKYPSSGAGLTGPQTLSPSNFQEGSTLVHSGAAATYTVPSRLLSSDTDKTDVLVIHNIHATDSITLSASGVTLSGSGTIAAGKNATLEWMHDGTTERVIVTGGA